MNCSLSPDLLRIIFVVVLYIKKVQDDSEEYCGFYHHSNVVEHKSLKEGVGLLIRTPSLRLLGARARLAPVQRYNDDK